MRIFFIGTVSFSKAALLRLLELKSNIVGVATKSQSKFNADHVDLAPICVENDIEFKHVRDINADHILDWITSLNPDVIFCFGWSSLIKEPLLSLTKHGVVGFHPTALPLNRGRHPIIWSLVLGLKESATTFFFMQEGADDGDILSQSYFEINYDDDAASVYEKVQKNALDQIKEFVPLLEKNNYKCKKQDLAKGNIWRKRGMRDGEIDFRMNSLQIYNLVRGLTKPYVGAHIFYKDSEIKIWRVKEEEYNLKHIEPGKVLEVHENTILVKTGDAAIRIMEHDFETLPLENEYL